MAIFAITYDLNKQKNYQKLWDEFDRLKAHKAANSFYLLNANNTLSEILEHFKGFVDKDDTLVVVKTRKGEITYSNAKLGTNKWLSENA